MSDGREEMTSVSISNETWKDLNQRKETGDSFDDVINRVLESSITISDNLWKELNERRERGDTFEDVIWRVIEEAESSN